MTLVGKELGGSVNCEVDDMRMHGELDRLCDWADAWQFQFNVDKCLVIH